MTLTIETTVQENIEVPVPYFARRKDGSKYIGLLDANTVLTFFAGKGLTSISNAAADTFEKRRLAEAWSGADWTTCTETEFLEKYDSVLKSISLRPNLVE